MLSKFTKFSNAEDILKGNDKLSFVSLTPHPVVLDETAVYEKKPSPTGLK